MALWGAKPARGRKEGGREGNLLRMKSAASHKRPESGRCCSDFQGQARIRSGAGSGRFDGDWTNNEPTDLGSSWAHFRPRNHSGKEEGPEGDRAGRGRAGGRITSSSSSLAAVLSPNSSLVVGRLASLGEIQSLGMSGVRELSLTMQRDRHKKGPN